MIADEKIYRINFTRLLKIAEKHLVSCPYRTSESEYVYIAEVCKWVSRLFWTFTIFPC